MKEVVYLMRKNKFCRVEKETDLKAIELFNDGMSLTKISKELKIDRGCLSNRLKQYGITIKQHCNKKSINSKVFEKIDTEEKAYWLGFLMADGSISNNNKIELSIKDLEHIKKFKSFLNSSHEIEERHNILNGKEFISYRISFQDKQIGEKLKSYGCIPRKTFEMHIPNIDNNLFRHWLRGYFDGDGCISYCKAKQQNKGAWHISISSGNAIILNEIIKKLNTYDKYNNLKLLNSHTCFDLRTLNIYDTKILLDFIYKDSKIYLERKYNLYIQYCRLKSKNLKS